MRSGWCAAGLVALVAAGWLLPGGRTERFTVRGRVAGAGRSAEVTLFRIPDGGGAWPVLATVPVGRDRAFAVGLPPGDGFAVRASDGPLLSPCATVGGPDGFSEFELVLQPAPPVEVLVTDDAGGPAAGARVVVEEATRGAPPRRRPVAEVRADAAGRAVLPPVPPPCGRITVRVAGFLPAVLEPLPADAPAAIRLDRGRPLAGVVLDADGVPVAGALVAVAEREAVTDEAGRFLLPAAPSAGDFVVRADGGDRGRADRTVSRPAADGPLTVRLTPVRRIAGRILLFRGVVLEDLTGAEGRFCLLGLRPGPHHVTVEAAGFEPERLRHVLCGRTDLRVTLSR